MFTYFLIEEKEGWASLFFIFTCFTIFSTFVTLKNLKDNIEKPKMYIYEYNKEYIYIKDTLYIMNNKDTLRNKQLDSLNKVIYR